MNYNKKIEMHKSHSKTPFKKNKITFIKTKTYYK